MTTRERPRRRLPAAAGLLLSLACGNAGASQPEPIYPELLGEVCTELRQVRASAMPSLEGKEPLLAEAARLHLPHELRDRLAERLRHNAFSIAEAELWEPHDSFDLTLQARSREAAALKVRLSQQRYDEYARRFSADSEADRDAVRRAALMILAESGHLPDIMDADEMRVRFVYREACVVSDGPGLMTTFIQGRVRDLDRATGLLAPPASLRPELARLSDPALAFSSDGTAIVRLRAAQLDTALATPQARALLRTLHQDILETLGSPERTRASLLALVDLVTAAWAIDPVRVDFHTGPAGNGGSGYYFHDSQTYTFHYRRFLQRLDRHVAREGLDLAQPRDRQRASAYILGELVNNAAHELMHAAQYQWMDRWDEPGAIPDIARDRVADYRLNHRYKNTAWESHTLIGVLGEEDYARYRFQPIEADAWAIGSHAETLTLQVVEELPANEQERVASAATRPGDEAR